MQVELLFIIFAYCPYYNIFFHRMIVIVGIVIIVIGVFVFI